MSNTPRAPKEPGTLHDRATRYVIEHRSRFYSPWVIEAQPPTWRDIWPILRRRFHPKLVVRLMLNSEGTNWILKQTWTSHALERQLYENSTLLQDVGADSTSGHEAIRVPLRARAHPDPVPAPNVSEDPPS